VRVHRPQLLRPDPRRQWAARIRPQIRLIHADQLGDRSPVVRIRHPPVQPPPHRLGIDVQAGGDVPFALTREFAPPPRPLADALTFCDMTTSPDGEHVQVHNRLAEIHDRYGTGHLVSRSIRRATPFILEAVGQVCARAALLRDAHHEHLPPPIVSTATAVLSRPPATGS